MPPRTLRGGSMTLRIFFAFDVRDAVVFGEFSVEEREVRIDEIGDAEVLRR